MYLSVISQLFANTFEDLRECPLSQRLHLMRHTGHYHLIIRPVHIWYLKSTLSDSAVSNVTDRRIIHLTVSLNS